MKRREVLNDDMHQRWNAVTESLQSYLQLLPKRMMAKSEWVERVVETTIDSTAGCLAQRVRMLAKCESPIECLFALALNDLIPTESSEQKIQELITLADIPEDDMFFNHYWEELEAQHPAPAFAMPTKWDTQVAMTVNGQTYRADFMLTTRIGDMELRTVVETDGHDHHERTKEQAARDKKRDRDMAAAGIQVLRFTGSEVWKDPAACALEALTFVNRLVIEWATRLQQAHGTPAERSEHTTGTRSERE